MRIQTIADLQCDFCPATVAVLLRLDYGQVSLAGMPSSWTRHTLSYVLCPNCKPRLDGLTGMELGDLAAKFTAGRPHF